MSSPPGGGGVEALIPDEGLSIYWGFQYGGLGLGTPGSWNPLTSEPQRDVGFMFPEENRPAHSLPVPQEAVGFESSCVEEQSVESQIPGSQEGCGPRFLIPG